MGTLAIGLVTLMSMRRARNGAQAASVGSRTFGQIAGTTYMRWIRVAVGVAGEQLGSPGERIVGLRTVDARTGRRVELWRRLVLVAAAIGSELVDRRLAPKPDPVAQAAQQEYRSRLQQLTVQHAGDPPQLNAAVRSLYSERKANGAGRGAGRGPVVVHPLRAVAVPVALGLLQRRLARALAPTVVVLWPPPSRRSSGLLGRRRSRPPV